LRANEGARKSIIDEVRHGTTSTAPNPAARGLAAQSASPRAPAKQPIGGDVPPFVQTSVEFASACPATAIVMRKRLCPRRANLAAAGDILFESAAHARISMIAILWQFDVKRGHETEFEQLYGADGEWTSLNRLTRSYLGSSFLRDQARSTRYLLIEYWSEMVVYEQHKTYRSDALASFEARRDALLEAVEPLGIYTALDVPDRAGPTWSRRM
jgi:hypothetical protein